MPRIQALRTRGYRFATGGFGVSDTSFAAFASLEPEFVMLDASLVHDIDESKAARGLVERITRMCHELGTDVIADGIESSNELGHMKDLGCDLFQGRLFGLPIDDP